MKEEKDSEAFSYNSMFKTSEQFTGSRKNSVQHEASFQSLMTQQNSNGVSPSQRSRDFNKTVSFGNSLSIQRDKIRERMNITLMSDSGNKKGGINLKKQI